MQGLADGYFVLPYTIGDYLADDIRTGEIPTDTPEFEEAEKSVRDRIDFFMNNNGSKSVDHFHKRLGKIMWDKVGMSRNAEGLKDYGNNTCFMNKERRAGFQQLILSWVSLPPGVAL